jgi:hypothetical protein
MTFEMGEVVVCVRPKPPNIQMGEVYIVRVLWNDLISVKRREGGESIPGYFFSDRFAPFSDQPTPSRRITYLRRP